MTGLPAAEEHQELELESFSRAVLRMNPMWLLTSGPQVFAAQVTSLHH